MDSIKREFDGFIDSIDDRGSFSEIFYSISDFFMNPPFEGMDGIEYGVNEVCVFSVVEYFMWKTAADHDHERLREEYRSSIADRTYEEVADHWIKWYMTIFREDMICWRMKPVRNVHLNISWPAAALSQYQPSGSRMSSLWI